MMHAVIVANAPVFDVAPFAALMRDADLIIAADGGGNALDRLGLLPQLVVGDLDSLRLATQERFRAAGVTIVAYSPAKDETDLELALLHAVRRGAQRIDVLGALGGRWDQSLANVALLALPELAACTVRLLDANQELFLVRDRATIDGQRGATVSLIPLGGPAHGITTQGLEYALADATLEFARSRGISNVLEAPPAHISLTSGMLLVVHTFQ